MFNVLFKVCSKTMRIHMMRIDSEINQRKAFSLDFFQKVAMLENDLIRIRNFKRCRTFF